MSKVSETLVAVRNGVEIDSDIERLNDDLDTHIAKRSLPDHGLVLAYNFPPFADASAATVAKRIRQLGRKVDVVSQDMSEVRHEDPDLTELVTGFIDRHFLLKGQPGFAAWPFIRNYVIDGYSAVKSLLASNEYGFLYSRSMFPATHFLAAFIKSRHPELLWISEFSDPVRHDVEGNDRPSQAIPADYVARNLQAGVRGHVRRLLLADQTVFAWCETLGIMGADRVIFTNEHQRDVMLKPYLAYIPEADVVQKSVVSPHPTLSMDFYNRTDIENSMSYTRHVNLGYFGEFYPNRGVGELVRAVGGLPLELRGSFRVHVFTSNVVNAKRSLEELAFDTSFVRVRPSKNLFTFLKLASKMDALYLSDVATGLGYSQNPYLPSKFSDYRGAAVPVIASVWPGSILSRDDALNRFLIGDHKSLSKFLVEFSANKLNGEDTGL